MRHGIVCRHIFMATYSSVSHFRDAKFCCVLPCDSGKCECAAGEKRLWNTGTGSNRWLLWRWQLIVKFQKPQVIISRVAERLSVNRNTNILLWEISIVMSLLTQKCPFDLYSLMTNQENVWLVCVTGFLTVTSYDTKVVCCILRHFQLSERSKFLLRKAASELRVSLPSFYWLYHLSPCNFCIFPSLKMGLQRSSFCVRGGNSTQRNSMSQESYQNRAFRGASGNSSNPATLNPVRMCLREFRERFDPLTACGFTFTGCLLLNVRTDS
jgi:hypothetical protein